MVVSTDQAANQGYGAKESRFRWGTTMTDPDSSNNVSEESSSRKRKTIVKRSKTEASPGSSRKAGGASRNLTEAMPERLVKREQDPQIFVKIQERAYWLFQAAGFKHGHDLEHWLEAERQVTGSSDRQAV
jgi:Protein of unknown function (DUF2934)